MADGLMARYLAAVNRLAKWRSVLTGWQLGTRMVGDPESEAVRDHREATLIQRAELTALTHLLIKKGVFTVEEFQEVVITECGELQKILEQRFPGIRATEFGVTLDQRAAETMKDWPK